MVEQLAVDEQRAVHSLRLSRLEPSSGVGGNLEEIWAARLLLTLGHDIETRREELRRAFADHDPAVPQGQQNLVEHKIDVQVEVRRDAARELLQNEYARVSARLLLVGLQETDS
jgi:hypothetical protein